MHFRGQIIPLGMSLSVASTYRDSIVRLMRVSVLSHTSYKSHILIVYLLLDVWKAAFIAIIQDHIQQQ